MFFKKAKGKMGLNKPMICVGDRGKGTLVSQQGSTCRGKDMRSNMLGRVIMDHLEDLPGETGLGKYGSRASQ